MAQVYYSPISINSAQVPSTQTDFPVLVSQIDNRFKTIANGGHVANANGYDIRPYSDSALTTALTYELERYNATTGEVVMWVKVASLSSSTTPIYLGYGDAALTTDGSSTATWSNSFIAVHHLKDGTTLSMLNSKGGTVILNSGGATAVAGQINGAANFVAASSQYLEESAGGWTANALTYSAWIKGTSFPAAHNPVFGKGFSSNSYDSITVKSNGKLLCRFATQAVILSYDGTGSHTLLTGTWYHVAITYDSTAGLIGYVNASSDGTVAANGNGLNSAVAAFVGSNRGATTEFWNGIIDEFRVSNTARSADWLTTEYNNQSAPATFETLGSEVTTATYTLVLAQGSYVLTGEPIATSNITQGSYVLTGETTGLSKNSVIGVGDSSDQRAYFLTGRPVGLRRGRPISITQGSYTLTGEPVNFPHVGVISLVSGSYLLNGQTVTLTKAWKLSCASGSYALNGQSAGFLSTKQIQIVQGGYALSGQPVGFKYNRKLMLTRGLYVLTGQPILFTGPFVYIIDLNGNFTPTKSGLVLGVTGSSLSYEHS